MGGGKGPKAPPPRDYYKETSDALRAQVDLAPSLYAAELAFQPKYRQLELAGYRNALLGRTAVADLSTASQKDYNDALTAQSKAKGDYDRLFAQIGYGGSTEQKTELNRLRTIADSTPDPASFADEGLLSILERQVMPSFARSEAATLATQREADIRAVETLGRRASEAYLNSDPRSRSLLEAVNAESLAGVRAGTGLTPQQERFALQTARRGIADRGLGLGNQGLIADVLGTYRLGVERQQMALQNANATLALNKQFTADPFQSVLGRQGQAFGAGISQQQFASGFASNLGPRLFSPESQYMADMQGSNQQTAAAYAAAGAQVKSGIFQGLSSMVGSGLGAYGALKNS
jgi:hypothetical protein